MIPTTAPIVHVSQIIRFPIMEEGKGGGDKGRQAMFVVWSGCPSVETRPQNRSRPGHVRANLAPKPCQNVVRGPLSLLASRAGHPRMTGKWGSLIFQPGRFFDRDYRGSNVRVEPSGPRPGCAALVGQRRWGSARDRPAAAAAAARRHIVTRFFNGDVEALGPPSGGPN